jgi:predicted glycoside hydrolase/deacetylase ChbG (UPF0249 family)
MKRLIINADDLGMNAPRSHGIFQAYEQGAVTSVTIIPNGSHSDAAAKRAREWDMPAGLHFNLTEGQPLSDPDDISTLLEANGFFKERISLRKLLDEGRVEPEHIERELRTQLEWFLDHCGQPTHVDGHHHIHIHPAVIPLLCPILDRYGISYVRIPQEDLPPFGYTLEPDTLARAQIISVQAAEARKHYRANGLESTDHFRGLALHGHASKKNLRHTLSRLPDGTTELMTHPGSPAAEGTPFDLDPQRQTEFQMLIDPEFSETLNRYGITLCSWRSILG